MIHGTGVDRTTAFPHWKIPIFDDSAQATSRANAGGAIRAAPRTHACQCRQCRASGSKNGISRSRSIRRADAPEGGLPPPPLPPGQARIRYSSIASSSMSRPSPGRSGSITKPSSISKTRGVRRIRCRRAAENCREAEKIPPTRRRRSRRAGLGALSHGTVPSNHWPLVRVSRGPFGIRDRMATASGCPARGRAADSPCLTRLPRPVERFRAPLLAHSPPGAQVTDQRCRSQCLNQTQPARQRSPVLPGATSSSPQNGDEQNVRLGGDRLGRPRQGLGGFPGAGSRSRRFAASGRSNSAQP